MDIYSHREKSLKAIQDSFPQLELHSIGAACGKFDWDAGFFVKDKKEEDKRSLEFRGLSEGFVKVSIVENYLDRVGDEPQRVLNFGGDEIKFDGSPLPKPIAQACNMMVNGQA